MTNDLKTGESGDIVPADLVLRVPDWYYDAGRDLVLQRGPREVHVPRPRGSENWSEWQRAEWPRKRAVQLGRRAHAAALTAQRAHKENYTPPSEAFALQPVGQRVVIRACYGPLMNLDFASLVVAPYDERLLQQRCADVWAEGLQPLEHAFGAASVKVAITPVVIQTAFGSFLDLKKTFEHLPPWGPKQFVAEILARIAKYGGNATLYLVHSGLTVDIDEAAFRRWAEGFMQHPETALIEAAHLLTGAPDAEH